LLCPTAISHLGAKQSTSCGGPAWRKTCKQNSFWVGVVWQTEHRTTSGSNEEKPTAFVKNKTVCLVIYLQINIYRLGYFIVFNTPRFQWEFQVILVRCQRVNLKL